MLIKSTPKVANKVTLSKNMDLWIKNSLSGSLGSDQLHFLMKAVPLAQMTQRYSYVSCKQKGLETKLGVFTSITLAQAILESAWGRSHMGEANNYFGIKASKYYKGKKIEILTTEFTKDGKPYKIKDWFRAYDSMFDSFVDHVDLFISYSRYRNVLIAGNYQDCAIEIQNAGYATVRDKDGNLIYGSQLIKLVEKYSLFKFDLTKYDLS